MWRSWVPSRPATTAILALQSHAERAGYALACSYSSSAELEAAVIRARLDAGAYGGRRRRRAFISCAAAAIAVAALLALVLLG
jgi:hypothetical protein